MRNRKKRLPKPTPKNAMQFETVGLCARVYVCLCEREIFSKCYTVTLLFCVVASSEYKDIMYKHKLVRLKGIRFK